MDCMNGGICVVGDSFGNFCDCDGTGFAGPLCQVEMNECTDRQPGDMTVICGPNSSCRNTIGSFECDCDEGFEGNGKNLTIGCTEIDECVNATCGIGTCIDGIGNFTCDCGVFAQGDQCESYAHFISSFKNVFN